VFAEHHIGFEAFEGADGGDVYMPGTDEAGIAQVGKVTRQSAWQLIYIDVIGCCLSNFYSIPFNLIQESRSIIVPVN